MVGGQAAWSLTESDPGVFTSLLTKLGVQGLQVDDLWCLDEDLLREMKPLALIFLFKHMGNSHGRAGQIIKSSDSEHQNIMFAQQLVNNSCGSMAILNAVLNVPESVTGPNGSAPDFKLGDKLTSLKEFAIGAGFTSEMLGNAISTDDEIRIAHNSFARYDPFFIDESAARHKDDDAAYHFIVFQEINGQLIELDGLQEGPIYHGDIEDNTHWTAKAQTVIQARINSYSSAELNFSLLALIGDKLSSYQNQLLQDPMDVQSIESSIRDEMERREEWKYENSLRGPDVNLVALVHNVLIQLAKQDDLQKAIIRAGERNESKK